MGYTREWSYHKPDDPQYRGPDQRMCPGCPEDKNIHKLIQYARQAESYSVLCRECSYAARQEMNETAQVNAITTLTKSLAKSTRRSIGGQSYANVLATVCEPVGGVDEMFKMTGKAFKTVMRRAQSNDAEKEDLELAVKVGKTLLDTAAAAEKAKGPAVDLSDLTEEELRDILMEPAKQLILGDESFRRQLLDDPQIRRLLLADAGVELIDSEAVLA